LNKFQIPKAQKEISGDLEKTVELISNYIKRINKKPFEKKKKILVQSTQNSGDDSILN